MTHWQSLVDNSYTAEHKSFLVPAARSKECQDAARDDGWTVTNVVIHEFPTQPMHRVYLDRTTWHTRKP